MRHRTLATCLLVTTIAILNAPNAGAAKPRKDGRIVALTPQQAGPDFKVQGEYVGDVIDENGDTVRLGVQVIALGHGKFDAVAYPGGLPGNGWNRQEKIRASGETRDDGVTYFTSERGRGEIRNGVLTVWDKNGRRAGELKRIVRKSPTLGQKPPKGAVVLFDGTSAENFINGRIENGLLKEGCTSKQKFQDHKLHIEFLLSFMPEARGQARANSGVYLQGRYEVQVLDSFGLEGRANECGAIYGIKAPDVNMCFPPLSWQTYDVEFTAPRFDKNGKKIANARMTVWHNGVLIHDNVEVPRTTTAAPVKEGPEPGPLYLQNHGNPIRYRNIWVVEKR
ncbi:MAG: DUF1080 domain-containing protein [Planctomycetota bacterium]|nr:MAG: DUF1080 domain-containing protein [Planctomycetota bacterium]